MINPNISSALYISDGLDARHTACAVQSGAEAVVTIRELAAAARRRLGGQAIEGVSRSSSEED